MQAKEKKNAINASSFRRVEDVVGCKWSLSVIRMLKQGVNRPGAMQRNIDGISTKVLNERLRKLLRYGIADKKVYPVTPPKVEYSLTEFGEEFVKIIESIEALDRSISKKQN